MGKPVIDAGWVGRVIDGRFALHEFLGGSNNSGVFRTDVPPPLAKRAALKLIPAEGAEADAYTSGWARVSTLSHPHLTRLFRSGRFQFGSIGLVYVVTECADELLSEILPQRVLTTDETREMLVPVIDALGYLHEKGFVHGHLKPSNVLVVDDRVKLSGDEVMASGLRNRFDRPGGYDAPEIAAGTITSAADVWSLGLVLVEALTQQAPDGEKVASRESLVPETMPRAFAEIARDCLRYDPAKRCTLRELRERLEPNRPIAFPATKAEKAQPAAAVEPVFAGSVLESLEAEDAAPTRMRFLPVVLAIAALLVLFAALMLRHHPKPNAQATAITEGAPEGTPAGTDASSSPSSSGGSVQERAMPRVTPEARRTIHGTVVVAVQVSVDAHGTVRNAAFKTEGPSRYFAKTAMEAARNWKFKPAVKNGQAASSEWVLRFKFRQSGDEAAAVEKTR
jgi:TonB family protein